MSTGLAKLALLVLFIINCVLWSQSRYGHVQEPYLPSVLIKRISYELEHVDSSYSFDGKVKQCRPLAFPIDSQCAHVKRSCPVPKTFLAVHYLRSYFCEPTQLRPLVFTGLLLWLVFLFSTLGISAADFFTPNLATIAHLLGLDENVAGVTFLAFGNGSPDVFSTFSAMRANSGTLAIGELLGAASFIVSCVVGSMCIIKPFKVDRRPFLRDVGFFTVAVSVLLGTLWDNQLVAWEAGGLIVMYAIYVAVVVVGSWWDRRQEKKRRIEALIRAEYEPDVTPSAVEERYQDDPGPSAAADSLTVPWPPRKRATSSPGPQRLELQTQLPPRSHSHLYVPSADEGHTYRMSQMPSFSLVGALEFRQIVAALQRQGASSSLDIFESPMTPYAGGHYHAHRRPSTFSREADSWDATLGVPLDDRSPHQILITPALSDEAEEGGAGNEGDGRTINPSIPHSSASPTVSDIDTESQHFPPPRRRHRVVRALNGIYHTLCPSLHHFKSKTVLGKVAAIFAAPAIMALTLTLPVVVTPYDGGKKAEEKTFPSSGEGRLVDFEEEGTERVLIAEEEVQEDMHNFRFSKWLTAAQCVFGPLFCVGVLFGGTKHFKWLLVAVAIAGVTAGTLVAIFGDKGTHPATRSACSSLGFLVAIVWIMAIADEVVHVLSTFGLIFGLSDAIIGLTIFAIGNSLADLVANMAVAVFAPIMGFSACFGGPMLNILLGVGISGTYVISQNSRPYYLPFSQTLVVSTVGLLAILLATLVFVPWNGYFLSRRWGICLIASYVILMTINVVVELKS